MTDTVRKAQDAREDPHVGVVSELFAEMRRDGMRRSWPGVANRKQLAFLAAFRVTANLTLSARVARVHRATVYRWQEHDDAFGLAYQQAEQESTDLLEAEAFRRAYEGVYSEKPIVRDGAVVATTTEIQYSDALMTFLLKARRPGKYRERLVDAEGNTLDLVGLLQLARSGQG